MKALIVATTCVCLLVSCAEFAVMTAATETRTLSRSQWGEFEKVREFVTLQPLAFYPSTKGLVPIDQQQPRGADGKVERRILIPRASNITVTRIALTKFVDPNWNVKQGRIIYGILDIDGYILRDVHLNVIAEFDIEPTYNRQVVSPR